MQIRDGSLRNAADKEVLYRLCKEIMDCASEENAAAAAGAVAATAGTDNHLHIHRRFTYTSSSYVYMHTG
jgi:hypothetical protein